MDALKTFEAPQRFLGLEIGARMTAIRIADAVLLYSPIDIAPTALEELGTPRWLLAPSRLHHLYVGPWLERGIEAWAAPGLPEKRTDLSFDHIVEQTCTPFGDDVQLIPLRSFSLTNEVVLFHAPSRTLVVADLVFNFNQDTPWLTRAAMWASGAYPGCRVSILERLGMDRTIARKEIRMLLDLDFDRLIPAHGGIIKAGGREALRSAYAWLGLYRCAEF